MTVWDVIHRDLPKVCGECQHPVLSFTDSQGYPFSVRCTAEEAANGTERFFAIRLPPDIPTPAGSACLLWHRHDQSLGGMTAFALRGQLTSASASVTFIPHQVAGHVGIASASPDSRSDMIHKAERYLQRHHLPPPEMKWETFEDLVRQAARRSGRTNSEKDSDD